MEQYCSQTGRHRNLKFSNFLESCVELNVIKGFFEIQTGFRIISTWFIMGYIGINSTYFPGYFQRLSNRMSWNFIRNLRFILLQNDIDLFGENSTGFWSYSNFKIDGIDRDSIRIEKYTEAYEMNKTKWNCKIAKFPKFRVIFEK